MIDIKKPKFSFSQLQSYEACPKKYHYLYILSLPPHYNHALAFGTTLHSVMSDFYTVILHDQKNHAMFENATEEFLLSLLDQHWITRGYLSEEHLKQKKGEAVRILQDFFAKNKDNFGHPLFLEKGFSLDLGDFTISGRFDRVDDLGDKKVEIIDYKSSVSKKESDVKKSLQLSIYALAVKNMGLVPEKLSLYFLGDNKKVTVEKSDKDLEKAEEKIHVIADKIISKDFDAKPSEFICKRCDYRDICEDRV